MRLDINDYLEGLREINFIMREVDKHKLTHNWALLHQ